MSINGRVIGPGHPPYIIAEMSANHNGSLKRAIEIIDMAKATGADAVKLQTYTADTLTIQSDRPEFKINGGLWDGYTLYELYKWAAMPWDWHAPLFEHARRIGMTIFSSPFDETAIDLLESLDAPAYKIASFEAIDLPLIERVAKAGKPMIISTGLADEAEIQQAIDTASNAGCKEIAILHCVSGYPAPAADYDLLTIPDMIDRFGCITGLSDHTIDNTTAIASVALGASLIEKHVTLDRSAGGPDDSFSLEPEELKALCVSVRTAWEAVGTVNYRRKDSEKANLQFRRSIYFVRDVAAGEEITPAHIRIIRPGLGLAPKHFKDIVGRRTKTSVAAGTPASWNIVEC